MRRLRCALLATALVATGIPNAHCLDFSNVTCRAFLASGQANMAAMFMFLRGYLRPGTHPTHYIVESDPETA